MDSAFSEPLGYRVAKDCPNFDEKNIECNYKMIDGYYKNKETCIECKIGIYTLWEKNRQGKNDIKT